MEAIIIFTLTVFLNKNLKEEKDLDLVEIAVNFSLNFGLIKIFKKVQFIMEKTQHMDMEA
jgi:hypothetical protein